MRSCGELKNVNHIYIYIYKCFSSCTRVSGLVYLRLFIVQSRAMEFAIQIIDIVIRGCYP